jgi:hypothetical protein
MLPKGGGAPTDALADTLRRDFGSGAQFKAKFVEAGTKLFVYDRSRCTPVSRRRMLSDGERAMFRHEKPLGTDTASTPHHANSKLVERNWHA